MVTGGANLGRIGVITNRERHPGSFDVVHVKDSTGNSFATRLSNIFVIGKVRTCRYFPVWEVGGLKGSELRTYIWTEETLDRADILTSVRAKD